MTRARAMRSTVTSARGGCQQCHGGNAGWHKKNALALAAQHSDRTGHVTWAETITRTTYGDGPAASRGQPKLL
jgi:hypothetical protein